MRTIHVGMLGIGNIGKGTWQTLEQGRARIEETTGLDIRIDRILCRTIRPERAEAIGVTPAQAEALFTTDPAAILDDPAIDIVVELMGGIEPATSYMAQALKNGKHVVTANKAAIAANGEMLSQLAKENNVMLRFEASVAGGIPIINAVSSPLLANTFSEMHGILNGTTNYILTQMSEYGKDYAEVLKDAQAKGFAEADPTADVEGIDAANKLSILISLIFGIKVGPDEIAREGITRISAHDIRFAKESGYRIKLLASAAEKDGKVYCSVEPALVPEDHPLASVSNEFNAVFVTGSAVDSLMFYGRGAGPLPTGSAVMGDVIEIAVEINKGNAFDNNPLLRYDADLTCAGEGAHRYYVRMTVANRTGVLGSIADTFGAHNISVKSVIQRGAGAADAREALPEVPLLFIVYETERSTLNEALAEISGKDIVLSVDNILRVED